MADPDHDIQALYINRCFPKYLNKNSKLNNNLSYLMLLPI